MRTPLTLLALVLVAIAGVAALAAPSAGDAATASPTPAEVPLDGRSIYQCVLDNRFSAFAQESRLVSGDRGDSAQETRLELKWKDWRDADQKARRGVLSKTMVKYTHPFELRFSGYLVVANEGRRSDQFVYLNESRRIRRVSLRREAVFGTDFSFEDIVPDELDDADYHRLEDGDVDGSPVYRVEVIPRPHMDSEYSRFLVSVEKPRCVPLRIRYWDDRKVEVKELTASPASIREFEGIHVATEATMRNLKLETFTTLHVESLVPDRSLPDHEFDLRRLEAH